MEEGLPSKWRAKKKAGVAILGSDKTEFKPKKIKRDKQGYYIMVKKQKRDRCYNKLVGAHK